MTRRAHALPAALVTLFLLLVPALPGLGGFPGTDVVVPASARAAGAPPSQFYSTLWLTNASTHEANVTLRFLQRDVSNTAPVEARIAIAPGETRKLENFVETLFGLTAAAGAVRVLSDEEVLVSSRTYNLPAGAQLRDANGLFFSGIPRAFALGIGEVAQLQGVSQGGSEDFRYNFGLVEVAGAAATVRVAIRNPDGTLIGQKDYALRPFEAKQFGVGDAAPAIATANARLEASVVDGTGKVIVYGTGIANGSQDSIGFEMSFKTATLAGGVSSLNGLSGAVSLTPGANIVITPIGNSLTIGANLPIGGLTLPFAGNAGTSTGTPVFAITNTGFGSGISAVAPDRALVASSSSGGAAVAALEARLTNTAAGANAAAVRAINDGTGTAGIGVWGSHAGAGWGVYGTVAGAGRAVVGDGGANGVGVYGVRGGASGLTDTNAAGVWGDGTNRIGVLGTSRDSVGVVGASTNGYGVQGATFGSTSNAVAVAGFAQGNGFQDLAGFFSGPVQISGTLSKTGGSFKIDHPLDPENRTLSHSFVESPDMKNVYDGVAVLDAKGEAVVDLPDWFEALNRDFRYQLTCIGAHAPVYVARKIAGNRFAIAGGKPGLEVSWQVTGTRRDRWAEKHRIPVEELKPEAERGTYLNPDAFDQPEEKGVLWARDPERMKALKAAREAAREAARADARGGS